MTGSGDVAINYEWVLEQFHSFLKMTERVETGEVRPYRLGEGGQKVYRFASSEEDIREQAAVVRLALQQLFPGWSPRGMERSLNTQMKFLRDDVYEAIPQLARAEEIGANLSPDSGPSIAADSLHPWIWDAARPHWDSGNYRAAVHAASTNLNSRTKRKSGRQDLSESALLRDLFSLDDPAPGRPRLRLAGKDNPDHFKNVHVGASSFGAGLFSAVRNPVAHLAEEEHGLDEQEALECLAAFSLLARWVDRAEVKTALPEPPTPGQSPAADQARP